MNHWYPPSIRTLVEVVFDSNRVMRQNALLWVLAIATEQGRPLGPLLVALANDEGKASWSAQLRGLAQEIAAGMPLADALERNPGLLPAHILLAIRVGTGTGTLPAMLREVAQDFSAQRNGIYSSWTGTLLYLGAVLMALSSIMGFLMYAIIPKFKKIFEDFGTELPALTVWVIEVSDHVVEWLPLISAGGLGGFAWLVWRARQGLVGGGFRRLVYSHGRSEAPIFLRIFSVIVARGRPVVAAVSIMARHHRNATMRNHLLFLRNEAEQGTDIWGLLAKVGLLKPSESHILDAAARAGNLRWALTEIAESIERDIDYRTCLLMEFFRPLILIVVTVMVGILAIGMFLPLVKLINDFV